MNTFTDFVQAFSQFGSDMVELAHLSGDRQNVSISLVFDSIVKQGCHSGHDGVGDHFVNSHDLFC